MQEIEIGLEQTRVSLESGLYELFYRQHGVRRPSQIENPIFSDIGANTFPRNSIYHYNPESSLLFGPLENNPWYANDPAMRFIDHVFDFKVETIGHPIRKPAIATQYIQAYRRKHRTLKFLRNFFNINRQPNMLIVYNYCLINQLYKYRPHRFVNYYRFRNLYSTIIANINQVANQSDRQHFFEIRMPKVLPTRAQFRLFSKEYASTGITHRYLTIFPDDDAMLLFNLWLWMGESRQLSIFNKLEQRNLSKINLLLTDSGKYVLINLGQLNGWISEESPEEDIVEMDDSGEIVSNRAESIQLKFYKLLNKLYGFRLGVPSEQKINAPVYTEADLKDETPIEEDQVAGNTPIDNQPGERILEEKVENNNPDLTQKKLEEATDKFLGTSISDKSKAGQLKQDAKSNAVNSRLKALPDIDDKGNEIKQEEENTVETKEIQDTPQMVIDDPELDFLPEVDPDEALPEDPYQRGPLKDAKALVKSGSMTAREYARIEKQASKYKEIKNPFDDSGKTTLADFIESEKHEDIVIKPLEIPDSPWILDKNMLTTTVEPLRRQYIAKSLKRDISKSMLSIQKAGMMVTDVQVETVEDAANKIDHWKLKVQPIGGSEATVNIQMPHIDREGVFKVNGIKYILRSQRKDVPIRKVSPTKVSLTSYYSKLSVSKAERKTFNIEAFYHTQLNAKVIDGSITHPEYGNVFNPQTEVPTVYSQIATRFKEFVLNEPNNQAQCVFDYAKRAKLVNNDTTKLAQLEEKYKGILFAKGNSNYYFISQADEHIYSTSSGNPISIEQFLNITKEPPTEMAEIKIFSNNIPLVCLLGYYKGITGLLRILEVKPRKIFRGQRAQLAPYEYAIKFADETWIFDRRNRKAMLVLSGLNQYKRYLADYSANQFDDPESFIALLTDSGVTPQIENEFKLMERMWVDDITATLLKQINEPTDFIQLLIRAADLLSTPYSRNEVNMDDMIIAGYQRIAGHVYKQLVGNVKTMMNNRSIQARKRFDMPPTHILQTIMKDPSVTLVDDINPIQNLKEHENVTFGGDGGRSRRSMVSRTRAYDRSDLGVISEGTVDSADVAVTTFLSANPALTTTLGNSKRIDTKKTSAAEVMSTTSNLYVASTRDDQQN